MARTHAFTPRYLEGLRPESEQFEVKDGTGLRLRVHPSGAKVWRWLGPPCDCKPQVHRHLHTFGDFPEVSLRQARNKLEELRGAPTQPKKPASMDTLIDSFLKALERRRKRPDIAGDAIERDIRPALAHLTLEEWTAPVTAALVSKVSERAPVYAGRVLQLCKQMQKFAESQNLISHNPARSLNADDVGVEHNISNRYLSTEEIPVVWRAIVNATLDKQTRLGLQLLFLTALRSAEVLGLRWSEVDLDKALLTIPPERRKLSKKKARTAGPFEQPLSDQALEVLKQLRAIAPEKSELVFHSYITGDGYTERVLSKAMNRLWKTDPTLKKLEPATPHDLRRTVRTHITGTLKFPPHVGEEILGHSRGVLVETYDKSRYLDEKRAALGAWADFVDGLVSGRSAAVVPLKQRRQSR